MVSDGRDPVRDSLGPVATALRAAGMRYMVVGGLATFAYGEPRTTQDIDLAVDVSQCGEDAVKAALATTGMRIEGPSQSEFGRRLWVVGGPLPVEVFLTGQHEMHQREFARSRVLDIDGPHAVPSPEDLVLRKLVNLRLRRSERDVRDLETILFNQWPTFDFEYVRQHGRLYRITSAFEQFVDKIRAERRRLGLPA